MCCARNGLLTPAPGDAAAAVGNSISSDAARASADFKHQSAEKGGGVVAIPKVLDALIFLLLWLVREEIQRNGTVLTSVCNLIAESCLPADSLGPCYTRDGLLSPRRESCRGK